MQTITRIIAVAILAILTILAPIGRFFVNKPVSFLLGGGAIWLIAYLLG